MTPKEQENNFQTRLIDSIQFIGQNKQPNGWLPQIVAVVDTVEDSAGVKRPNMLQCALNEICDDRTCYMNIIGSEKKKEIYALNEITNISHIQLWEKYVQLSESVWRDNAIEYLKENTNAPDNVIKAFVDTQWKCKELFNDNLEVFKRHINNESEKEPWIFTYPIILDRDLDDADIIANYEHGDNAEKTCKMTMDEFVALINDEMFDDANNWVRIINLPKNN